MASTQEDEACPLCKEAVDNARTSPAGGRVGLRRPETKIIRSSEDNGRRQRVGPWKLEVRNHGETHGWYPNGSKWWCFCPVLGLDLEESTKHDTLDMIWFGFVPCVLVGFGSFQSAHTPRPVGMWKKDLSGVKFGAAAPRLRLGCCHLFDWCHNGQQSGWLDPVSIRVVKIPSLIPYESHESHVVPCLGAGADKTSSDIITGRCIQKYIKVPFNIGIEKDG